MKVLIAEDEPKVLKFIRSALEAAGFVADSVTTPEDLLAALQTSSFGLLVLDRLLGDHDAVESLPEIRKIAPEMKILVLSALSETEEKVRGLSEGADDYLGKPFHVSELTARIHALTRREARAPRHLTFQKLRMELDTQRVFLAGKRLDLTGKEFRMLTLLARHPGQVFSKARLLDEVWDFNHFPESNVVEVTIANLRAKMGRGSKDSLIRSRRGVGYWLGEP